MSLFQRITAAFTSRQQGLWAALTSAFFLGMAPVFGRQAIILGMPPLAVAAIRTLLATLLLFGVMALFFRRYIFIYPAGLLGCLLAGWVNGLGSLFYYSALQHIGAGIGQLLYSLYPLFLVLWLALDNQPPSRLTLARMAIAIPAIVLLSQNHAQLNGTQSNSPGFYLGMIEMLIASVLYALHLPINQRVLYDMPAPTVTLYTLISMSAVVVPVFLFSTAVPFTATLTATGAAQTAGTVAGTSFLSTLGRYAPSIVGLTLVTFFSRLTLFVGVKNLGGMQTALLGLSEVLVTVIVAHLWLGERFSWLQWLGAVLLVISLGLVGLEKSQPRKGESGGFLSWLRPVGGSTDSWSSHE
jgi:drug/metabolite transporter (DMT)-like permease